MEMLNFPYYWYPQIPFSGYHNTRAYNLNLQVLKSKFIELSNKKSQFLFHLTVGAAAEELDIINEDVVYQWQQLLPFHIQTALKQGIHVIHFIVSPNESFNPDSKKFRDPFFMKFCDFVDINIIKNGHNTYINSQGTYECHIFYTMMPTFDKFNSKRIKKLIDIGMDKQIDISIFEQTPYDEKYVSEFYNTINAAVDNIILNNGFITCFSFATFNRDTKYASLCDFIMFPELKSLFDGKNINKCKYFEWMFSKYCYVLYECNKKSKNDFICYINPLLVPDIDINDKFLEIDDMTNNLVIK